LSSTVQKPVSSTPPVRSASDEHWSMLLFESCSVGVMAILVGILAVMLLVGIYVTIVWPLTMWDLTDTGLEKYASWARTVMWSIFGGTSLAAYWFISGAAFRHKPGKTVRAGKTSRR
jgi:hypothetical protein